MNIYRFSIPLKLFALLLPMVSLPIAIVGYWAHQTSVHSVTQLSREHQLSQAGEAARQIESIFQGCISTLTILGQVIADFTDSRSVEPDLTHLAEAAPKIRTLMNHFLAATTNSFQVALVDASGKTLLSVAKDAGEEIDAPVLISHLPWLHSTFNKAVYISPVKKRQGMPEYSIHLAKAFLDQDGGFKGAVVLELDFDKIIALVRDIGIGIKGYGFLVDEAGRTIAHPRYNPYEYDLTRYNDPRLREFIVHMLAGEMGWMTFNEHGEKAAAFAPVRTTGWSLAVSIPIEEFTSVAKVHKDNVVRVVVVMIVLSTMVVIFISFRLIRPMRNLVLATEQVAGGDLTKEIPVQSRDELGLLTESFNTMIRSLRDIQKELVTSEKLISLGRLSAGVAHEIRNPLNAIKGAIAYLRRRRADDALIVEYGGIIAEEVDRLNDFVSDFLLYSRQSDPKKSPININALLQSMLTLLAGQFQSKSISVDLRLDDDLPDIHADPQQLQQVFLNVLINALDAMEAGGRLIAATARGGGDKLDQILITIADDGGGIAEERLPYVFDPFFSTKDTGTGLGLPISLSIIENHRGHFRIVSRPGEGTTVIIEMPMA